MALFKSLKFDGEDSLDYGVHITGESVYNAPERDVEMIQVPGRNGEYALDHGRFNNIEVSYPAGMGEMSQEEFASKLSAFRNALASKKGYYRLEDDYHLDEYRMGIYKSGLEVSPVQYGRAGEFDLVFNCKPQRFLKSGEQRTELTESGAINNPTPFDSQPLLELTGYGTLEVNGSTIELHNESPGVIRLVDSKYVADNAFARQIYITNEYYDGDVITHKGFTTSMAFKVTGGQATNLTLTEGSGSLTLTGKSFDVTNNGRTLYLGATADRDFTFTAGAPASLNKELTATFEVNSVTYSFQVTYEFRHQDRGFSLQISMNVPAATLNVMSYSGGSIIMFDATINSTFLPLGSPLYLDCEIGEAYKIENGEIILINNNVDIPSDLPVLSPGENQIVMDDTYTKVGIIPRWWII